MAALRSFISRPAMVGTPVPAAVPAVSSAQRLQLFVDYVAAGGVLTMF